MIVEATIRKNGKLIGKMIYKMESQASGPFIIPAKNAVDAYQVSLSFKRKG